VFDNKYVDLYLVLYVRHVSWITLTRYDAQSHIFKTKYFLKHFYFSNWQCIAHIQRSYK
jgi:hypothetical protein